jgi:hypothetical protein
VTVITSVRDGRGSPGDEARAAGRTEGATALGAAARAVGFCATRAAGAAARARGSAFRAALETGAARLVAALRADCFAEVWG